MLAVGAPAQHAAAIDAPNNVVVMAPATPATPAPPETQPPSTESPIATNEFIPENQDLTTCIGVLERPGCGSESRGGWRQNLVFAILIIGLFIIYGNVAWGVAKSRRKQS